MIEIVFMYPVWKKKSEETSWGFAFLPFATIDWDAESHVLSFQFGWMSFGIQINKHY